MSVLFKVVKSYKLNYVIFEIDISGGEYFISSSSLSLPTTKDFKDQRTIEKRKCRTVRKMNKTERTTEIFSIA